MSALPRDHLGHFVPRATVPRTDPDTWDDTCTHHHPEGPAVTTDPTATRYRQRPNECDAVQWTGTNADQLRAFAGQHFDTIDPEDRIEDLDQDAQLLVEASHWVGIKPTDWVLRFEGYFVAKADAAFRAVWEPAVAVLPVSRAAVLREAADTAEDVAEGLRKHHEFERSTGALDVMAELRRLADEERDEQEAQANLDQLADLLPRMADEAQPCDGCGHPEHPARECPVTLYGERCACDEPLAAEAPPAATHSCGNCEGIDPDTCLMNPNRPPEQCPNSEFDGYGLQCQKPAGHNLCTFEEEAAETTHVVGDASETPECVDDCPGCEQEQPAAAAGAAGTEETH